MISLTELCSINIPLNRYIFDNKDYFYLARLAKLNYNKYDENINYEDIIKFYLEISNILSSKCFGWCRRSQNHITVIEYIYGYNLHSLPDYLTLFARIVYEQPLSIKICVIQS